MANDTMDSRPAASPHLTRGPEDAAHSSEAALVVGCGFMGRGIASVLLLNKKISVYLLDARGKAFCEALRDDLASDLVDYHRTVLLEKDESALELGVRADVLSRVVPLDMDEFCGSGGGGSSDGGGGGGLQHEIRFVFEAVFEDVAVKCEVGLGGEVRSGGRESRLARTIGKICWCLTDWGPRLCVVLLRVNFGCPAPASHVGALSSSKTSPPSACGRISVLLWRSHSFFQLAGDTGYALGDEMDI